MSEALNEKAARAFESLKELEAEAISIDSLKVHLDSLGHILNVSAFAMSLDDLEALYVNISSEYVNSIIMADFKDTAELKTEFKDHCETSYFKAIEKKPI